MAVQAPDAPYVAHRDYVLSVLGRRCGWLDPSDREAVFHDAYMVMLDKERSGELDTDSMHPQQLRAYLTQTAVNKALDEGKRAGRKRNQPLDVDGDGLALPDPGPEPESVVASSFDGARVREIVSELSDRARSIVKLRFFFDRTPDEIQGMLSISSRVYRRELERAMRYISERYELVQEGTFCDSRRSLILAYVAGIAGPNRVREAREHLATCPGCARWALEMREAADRVAAALPPVVLVDASAHGHLPALVDSVRDRVGDVAASVKQHAAALISRTDPGLAGPASGVRPGAAVALVAGCLAAGGGATYCVVEGIPGLGGKDDGKAAIVHPKPVKSKPKPAPQPKPRPKPEPRQSTRAGRHVPSTSQEAAANEFGPEGSSSGIASPSAPPPSPPGEFDP
jgi:RNA polymerase sigma factor (sigma-70 family)